MMYKINVNVHKWNQGQMVSDSELQSEGVDVSQWLKDNLIVQPEILEDLNKDGKVDVQDGVLASKVLNVLKGKKKGGR